MKVQSLILFFLIAVSSVSHTTGAEPNPENAGLFAQLPLEILSYIANITQKDCADCDCECCGKPILEWRDICQAQTTCKYMRKYFIHPERMLKFDFSFQIQPSETVPSFFNKVLVKILKGTLYPHKNPVILTLDENGLGADPQALTEFIHNLDTFGIARRIIGLQLKGNFLHSLPHQFIALHNLKKLDISGNNIDTKNASLIEKLPQYLKIINEHYQQQRETLYLNVRSTSPYGPPPGCHMCF